jgi:hypothetical protein
VNAAQKLIGLFRAATSATPKIPSSVLFYEKKVRTLVIWEDKNLFHLGDERRKWVDCLCYVSRLHTSLGFKGIMLKRDYIYF